MAIRVKKKDVLSVAIGTSSGTQTGFIDQDVDGLLIEVSGAIAGTSPTMDIYVQSSIDGGTTWFDMVHFAQVTGTLSHPLFATVPLNGATYIGDCHDASISAGTVSGMPIVDNLIRVKNVAGGTVGTSSLQVDVYEVSQSAHQ